MAAAAGDVDVEDDERPSVGTGLIRRGPDAVSRNLMDHYEKLVLFRRDNKKFKFNLQSFLATNMCYVRSTSFKCPANANAAEKRALAACPNPRLTSFIGGSFHFPYEQRHEIMRLVAMDIEDKVPMYWNQIAYDREGEGMRLAVDIDSNERVLDDSDVVTIARVLWLTLSEYYPNDFKAERIETPGVVQSIETSSAIPIEIYIAKCGPRIKKNKLSCGVHIIAHVKVTVAQARQILYGFKLRLDKTPGLDMTGLEVDSSIYKGAKDGQHQVSMRMIYAQKKDKCPMCLDLEGKVEACSFCDRYGQMAQKMTYVPLCCLNPKTGDDDPDHYIEQNQNFEQILRNYSLWPDAREGSHEYVKPLKDPVVPDANAVSKPATAKRKTTGGGTGAPARHMKKISPSDPVYVLVEEAIRAIVWKGEQLWKDVDVGDISLTESQQKAFVHITGIGSTLCPYAMKDHGTNRIYFSLTRKGDLVAMCGSDMHGCKEKVRTSPVSFPLPGTTANQVFGIRGPPNIVRVGASTAEHKNMTYSDFVKRQSQASYSHSKRLVDDAELQRQKRLKYLADSYELGPKAPPSEKQKPQRRAPK